jgi:hypothetical protein
MTMNHILIVAAIWMSAPWNPISAQTVVGGTPTASDEGVERDLSVVTSGNRGEDRQSVIAFAEFSQAQVLQELYDSTGGKDWKKNKGWDTLNGMESDIKICTDVPKLFGVTCNTNYKVTNLELGKYIITRAQCSC